MAKVSPTEAVLATFDFGRCVRAMAALRMEWWCQQRLDVGIPTEDDLRYEARRLLQTACDCPGSVQVFGPLAASSAGGRLKLGFVVEMAVHPMNQEGF